MRIITCLAMLALSSCGDDPATFTPIGDGGGGSGAGDVGAGGEGGAPGCDIGAAPYQTLAELHAQGIAKTCALNEGVCHSSREYPDMRTLTSFLETVQKPCNEGVKQRENVWDVCEPAGDALVVPALGLEHEIAFAYPYPDVDTAALEGVLLSLVTPFTPEQDEVIYDAELWRGDEALALGDYGGVVYLLSDGTIVVDLTAADVALKAFLDDRVYPWKDEMLRVADVNGNGTPGRAAGMTLPLVAPGDPMGSYLVQRLIGEDYGAQMPRQCRKWDDRASQAVVCGILGLQVDENGNVLNAYDPIDYETCLADGALDVTGLSACSAQTPDPGAVSFYDIEAIFASSCGGSACHVGESAPQAGLDLTPGYAYASLVGVASGQAPLARVEPGSVEQSYLACKLGLVACDALVGQMMPIGDELSDCDKQAIVAWIEQGAPLPPDGQ